MSNVSFSLTPADNDRLANLLGQFNEHLRQIESRLDVDISQRGFDFTIEGEQEAATRARLVLQGLYEATANQSLSPETVHLHLQEAALSLIRESGDLPVEEIVTRR